MIVQWTAASLWLSLFGLCVIEPFKGRKVHELPLCKTHAPYTRGKGRHCKCKEVNFKVSGKCKNIFVCDGSVHPCKAGWVGRARELIRPAGSHLTLTDGGGEGAQL